MAGFSAIVALLAAVNACPLHDSIRNMVPVDHLTVLVKTNDVNLKNEALDTALHVAAEIGYCSACSLLLAAGCELEEVDGLLRTPLMRAVMANQLETVKFFISEGAYVNAKDIRRNVPLLIAAKNGFVEIFRILFFHPDILLYSSTTKWETGLTLAAEGGHLDIVRMYIYGEPFGRQFLDLTGQVDLHKAVIKGRTAVTFFLTYERANNFLLRDKAGQNVLHYAAKYGRMRSMLDFIAKGTDVNCENAFGDTPLMCALHPATDDDGDVRSFPSDIVRALLMKGASIAVNNNMGQFVPEIAKMNGQYEALAVIKTEIMVKNSREEAKMALSPLLYELTEDEPKEENVKEILLLGKDSANSRDHCHRTALHFAVERGLLMIARILLEAGADAAMQDGLGNTPLNLNNGNIAMAMFLLLSNNQAAKIPNFQGYLPLHYALRRSNRALVGILSHAYSGTSNVDAAYCSRIPTGMTIGGENGSPGPLYCAILDEVPAVVDYFLDKGANANAAIFGGHTIAHAAAIRGSVPILTSLFNKANVPLNVTNEYGLTLLHCAIAPSSVDTAEFLLNLGIDTESKTFWGKTPLYIASRLNRPNFVRTILGWGANPYARTNLGLTALHAAAQYVLPEVMEILVKRDFEMLKLEDNWGETPVDKLCNNRWSRDTAPQNVIKEIILKNKITTDCVKENYLQSIVDFLAPSVWKYLNFDDMRNEDTFPKYLDKVLSGFMDDNGYDFRDENCPRDLLKDYILYDVGHFYSFAAVVYPYFKSLRDTPLTPEGEEIVREEYILEYRKRVSAFEASRNKNIFRNELQVMMVDAFMKERVRLAGTYMDLIAPELVEDILVNRCNPANVLGRIEILANSMMLTLDKREDVGIYRNYLQEEMTRLSALVIRNDGILRVVR